LIDIENIPDRISVRVAEVGNMVRFALLISCCQVDAGRARDVSRMEAVIFAQLMISNNLDQFDLDDAAIQTGVTTHRSM